MNHLRIPNLDRLAALRQLHARLEAHMADILKREIDPLWRKLIKQELRELQTWNRILSWFTNIELRLIGRISIAPAEWAGRLALVEFLCDTSACYDDQFARHIGRTDEA